MKVKKIKIGWLLLVIIAAFVCQKQLDNYVNNRSNNTLALVDVETLADDEYGHLPPCVTYYEYREQNQRCHYGELSYEIIGIEVTKYICNTNGNGYCMKGEDYVYYDCFGTINNVSYNAQDVPCKDKF